jgi:hypothetical protein
LGGYQVSHLSNPIKNESISSNFGTLGNFKKIPFYLAMLKSEFISVPIFFALIYLFVIVLFQRELFQLKTVATTWRGDNAVKIAL